jgi:hypothetical protein
MARRRHFTDADTAFVNGDFTEALRLAPQSALAGASLVMLGAFEAGERLLKGASDPRSLFCRAIVAWDRDDGPAAQSLLAKIPSDAPLSPAAARLRLVIARGKVRVLLQGRDDPNLPEYDVVGTMRHHDFAEIVSVGYPSHSDIQIGDTSTLDDVLSKLPQGWAPDFYLCSMIEDHPPPLGLERADFPTLYSTQDHDRHFQHCQPLMSLFDVGIAFSSVFHEQLQSFTGGGNAFVCPLLMGIESKSAEPSETPKKIDLYISGNLFNHSEGKLRHLWRISQLPDRFRIVLQNSYLSTDQYLNRLRDSKFTFGYVSNVGVLNSRVIEAMAEGCGGFYQDGSELGLFLGPQDGAVPYREDNLEHVITKTLDDWKSHYAAAVRTGIATSREIFDFRRVMRRHLILCTAYASLVGKTARRTGNPDALAIRYPNRSAIRVMYCHDGDPDLLLTRQEAFRDRLVDRNDYFARDAVGESLLYSHLFRRTITQKLLDERIRIAELAGPLAARTADVYRIYTDHHSSADLVAACAVYRSLTADFPDRMAAAFNYARLCQETGDLETAASTFHRIVDAELTYLPTDLLFWREFHDPYFDYEGFMWSLENYALTTDERHLRKIERHIRESALFYLCMLETEPADILARIYRSGELHHLHALNVETFRLLALSGKTNEAHDHLRHMYRQSPWIMTKFGARIMAVMEQHGIVDNDIAASWMRFSARLA